nr:putative ribonuclease H-like domain-containing protein [Tanacetum cinerariifolium]
GGYHAVPPPYTGTFMPPKPELVFHTAPISVETDHLAFNVQLNPTKPEHDLSHTTRPSAPIIEDWVSDSKEESQTKAPQDCNFHVKQMTKPTQRNHGNKGYHMQYASLIHSKTHHHLVPNAVLTQFKPVLTTAVRPVSAARPNISVTRPSYGHHDFTKSKLPIIRHITHRPSSKSSNLPPRVTTVKALVVSAAQGNPQQALKDKGVIDSGCSSHMTGNISNLSDFEELNGGYVAFGGNPKGGKITGKGKTKTCKLDFDDVYFGKELKFNLFSVLQMCDKKNSILFIDTECLVSSPDFKLPDKHQVLLRVPRENNMYNVNLKNVVPSGDLTRLFAKATLDESSLWHRRLGHINFKTINKLVKGNLVRGLPIKVFENDHSCVACKKGKQHRASCKSKPVSSVDHPLFRLYMDLFGPTFVKSLSKKSYCLVITDDYSRFTWVFFLATKNETSPILKTFITGLENQLSLNVKVIRSGNGTKFKNSDLNQLCRLKGIKREFSVPRTPQQNNIAKRKNRTLIEAARTMLADLLLPIPFWAEAVNTACYVQNRVLVTKPHNKTTYELLHGRTPSIGFMRPFGCLVTILNTLNPLGKFQGKVDEGFLVGYSVCSKAFRVFNSRTRIIQETLHVNFLENKSNVTGTRPTWLFDIDSLTRTMNYHPVTAGNQTNFGASFQDNFDVEKAGEEVDQSYMLFPVWSAGSTNPQNNAKDDAFDGKEHDFDVKKPESQIILSPSSSAQSKEQDNKTKKEDKEKSHVESVIEYRDLNAEFENCSDNSSNQKPESQIILSPSSSAQSKEQDNKTKKEDKGKSHVESVIEYRDLNAEFENVDFLPNEEIFAELARMGYEKPSTKLTFYKAIFLSQWKFLIYTILQSLSAKRTSWNELAQPWLLLFIQLIIQNQLGDLSTHTTKYTSPVLTQKVFANIRWVGKGFSGVETPLFEGMLVAGELEEQGDVEEPVQDDVDDAAAQGANTTVQGDDVHEPSIPSTTPPTPPPQQSQDLPSTSQEALDAYAALARRVEHLEYDKVAQALEITKLKRKERMVDELDRDEGATLMDDEGAEKKEDEPEVQEVVDVVTTAKLITDVVSAASESVTAASKTIAVAEPQVPAAPVRVAAVEPQVHAATITAAPTKEQLEEEENRAIQSINETPGQKAAKRRKLNEEVKDLKQHLEIVPDEDDDVYTEATPLAMKVPVVDYEIIHFKNKPHYKIIRTDGTDQLFGVDAAMDHEENTKCLMLLVVSAAKLPILNPNEFDLWKMRIEQYFLMTDYSLWEVILNGDSHVPTRVVDGVVQPVSPTTAEQRLARKNELKARGMFLMALPDKYQLKFNSHKDAKTLMEAIEKRFGLDQMHDRLQKLVSQLEIHRVSLSQEDVNMKFLHSLPSKWKTHIRIWRNKADLEEQSLDDLFNSLKIYEAEVKKLSSTSTASQNIAFVSTSHTDGTTGSISAAASISVACAKFPASPLPNVDSLSNAIHVDDLEEMDLRWQMAMLTMRAKRFLQKTGRNLGANEPTSMGFDMFKEAMWSYQAEEEPANFALIAFSSNSSSNNEVSSYSKACSQAYAQLHTQYDKLTDDFCKSQFDVISYLTESDYESWQPSNLYDRFKPSGGYHAVPPPYTGTFMPPKPDLVFHTTPTAVETNHLAFNSVQLLETTFSAATRTPASPKSNSSGKRRNRKACFVCKSVDHLIKDCNCHAKKMTKPTQRNHGNKGYHTQYALLIHSKTHQHLVPTAMLTPSKPVLTTTVRPVSAAGPNISVTRPSYAHHDFTKSKSPIRRHITRRLSSKSSNSPLRVTAVKAPVVSDAQVKQGTWVWRPKCPILDHDFRTTSASITLKRFDYNDHLGDPKLEDIIYSDDEDVVGAEADFNNLESFIPVSPIPTTIIYKDHHISQIIGDLSSTTQTRSMTIAVKDQGGLSQMFGFEDPDHPDKVYRVVKALYGLHQALRAWYETLATYLLENGFHRGTIDQTLFIKKQKGEILPVQIYVDDIIFVETNNDLLTEGKSASTPIDTEKPLLKDPDATKNETSPILNTFITGLENQLSLKVKVIRSDNGNEFKNSDLNQFYGLKGIKREFSVPRTPQQNGITERKNKTLIEATRTMPADLLLPIPFWAEAVNTACYVQNRVLVTKPHNKTLYELLHGTGPTWLFDIDSLTWTMNYHPVTAGNKTNFGVGFQDNFDAEKAREEDAAFDGKEHDFDVKKPVSQVNLSPSSSAQSKEQDDKTKKEDKGKSHVESVIEYKDLNAEFENCSDNSSNEVNAPGSIVPTVGRNYLNSTSTFSVAGPSNTTISPTYGKTSDMDASQLPDDLDMPELKDIIYSDDEDVVGAEADFNNLESFIPVSPISTTRIHKDHHVLQIIGDLSSTTQIRSMTRAVKDQGGLSQMFGFEDPDHPDKVCRVVKALYGLHQAPRAWYETLATYLLENGFHKGKIDQTLFIKKQKGDILLVQLYVDDIIFRLQVKQKKDGIFISQDKYVAEILRKFGLTEGKSASTPIDAEKHLLKDPDEAEYVAAASCCAQVLWIQNQLLDYGHKLLLFSLTNWCCLISDVSEGFNQIIDFLNGSYIKHALTINPHIHVSRIKQFWNNVVVKQSNDVTMLQALVDKKKVVITEATIRDALCLDDAEGVDCLPNKEIFAELARMGYEKPSTMLTFYKAFFLSQWKFLIYTILQLLSAKRTSWNEFCSAMASAFICLSTGRIFNFSKYIFESLVRNVDSSFKFYMYPRKRIFRVKTPLFKGMLVAGELEEQGDAEEQVQDDVDDAAAQGANTAVQGDDGRMIDELDRDEGAALMDDEGAEKKAEEAQEDELEVQEVVDVVTTAKLITEVVSAASESVTAASITIVAAEPQVPAATITVALVRVVAASKEPKPIKKKQQVEMNEEYARKLHEELNKDIDCNKDIDWNASIDHVKQKAKEDPCVQRYQGMSFDDIRPIFKSKFNLNIEFLLKKKEQLEDEENRAIQSINETPGQKATKRRKLNEEVKDLKQHLEIVPDEDDDVYTEATPLAMKVPVVDYEIIHFNNKPHYKIIRTDGTDQLFRVDAAMDHEENTKCLMLQVKNLVLPSKRYIRYHLTSTIAQFHLFKYGIDLSYTKWDKHGEKIEQATTAQIHVNATTEFIDDMDFNLDFGLEIPTNGPATVEIVNATKESFDEDDLAKFQELLLDAEKPLYKGCLDFIKLSAIVKLHNLKGKYGAFDKFFTELLGSLKKILPAGNEIVEKTYQARKLMRMMGSGYKKIHLCSNSCILYRKNNKELTVSPTYGISRWKVDIRHIKYSHAWHTKDEKFPEIAKDLRNLWLGISEPLVDDQHTLFETEIDTYDASIKENFNLCAIVLWTINDYPALGTLCGCPYSGFKGCVVCGKDTHCEVKLCGPICFRWMYSFERCMKVIKGHVRNKNRPEGCIAEETITEETIEFFSEYHKTMKTIGIPPDKHVTNENEDGKPLSTEKSSEISGEFFQKAHLCATQASLKTKNPGKQRALLENEHSKSFANWLCEEGVLQEIWVLDYRFKQIPLFKCDWVNHRAGEVKHDPNLGYTLVDLNSLGHKNDPFILASQARQVFYVKD